MRYRSARVVINVNRGAAARSRDGLSQRETAGPLFVGGRRRDAKRTKAVVNIAGADRVMTGRGGNLAGERKASLFVAVLAACVDAIRKRSCRVFQ